MGNKERVVNSFSRLKEELLERIKKIEYLEKGTSEIKEEKRKIEGMLLSLEKAVERLTVTEKINSSVNFPHECLIQEEAKDLSKPLLYEKDLKEKELNKLKFLQIICKVFCRQKKNLGI